MISKLTPLVFLALSAGCSSSNNDDVTMIADEPSDPTNQPEQTENIQFDTPDINGNSDLARASYPIIRDLSRELVTAAYLDSYFDINTEIGFLMTEALGGFEAFQNGEIPQDEWQAPYACPDGGTVRVKYIGSSIPSAPREAEFNDCELQSRSINGTLFRTQNSGVTGGGAFTQYDISFDNLAIDSDTNGTLTISGSSNTSESSTSPGATSDRGSCTLEGFGRQYSGSVSLQSAQVESPDQFGALSVNELSYSWSDVINYDATSNEASCPQIRVTTETGTTSVSFEDYGQAALNGDTTISTTIATNIDGSVISNTATQFTELPDASSVNLTTLPSTEECMTQIDISADRAALSFFDSYCFVFDELNLSL